MKSGLEGRNNVLNYGNVMERMRIVSMKSGLEGRNNPPVRGVTMSPIRVSMKSGLEGRNN